MVIYRIQHKKSKAGPYTHRWAKSFTAKHNYMNGHPNPSFDKGIGREMKPCELCGFSSAEQIKNWFTKEERRELKRGGFKTIIINATPTAIGDSQVLFVPLELNWSIR